jgi:hypothetical protein
LYGAVIPTPQSSIPTVAKSHCFRHRSWPQRITTGVLIVFLAVRTMRDHVSCSQHQWNNASNAKSNESSHLYTFAGKLRHPTSGKLYTCRLCCEQSREMATQDKDSPLDRYEVKEILCMRCNALQPASDKCINPECESREKPFARYTCRICNFYDDTPNKAIYHCPFCNVCRSGQGLGIDYRHCMRCNACVSLTDEHHCIPQRLQGNCPICHESMFESTEPLRGMKCGHGEF